MSYSSIESAIRDLYASAPNGNSEHTLDGYDQEEVAEVVNLMSKNDPKHIQETFVDYSGKAPIVFMKD